MDIGQKTLGQLSAERNEKKYITLETAAKISGYTKEYLERLCRLGKIEYRLWNNGQYVPELDSLLKETHTILVSFEGIQFVNKDETIEPPKSPSNVALNTVPETTIPSTSLNTNSKRDDLTFVVRPILSRVDREAGSGRVPDPDSSVTPKTEPRLPSVFGGAHIAVPVVSGEHEEWRSILRASGAVSVDQLPSGPSVFQRAAESPSAPVVASFVPPGPSDLESPMHSQETKQDTPESEAIAHPAIHLEVFDAQTLMKERSRAEHIRPNSSPVPPAPTFSPSASVLPEEVSGSQTASLPEAIPEHRLVPVKPHPITLSPTFNLTLIGLVAVAVALIGYLGSSLPQQAQVAQDRQNDLVASVAESFSDDVIVRDSGNGTVIVTPIFKSGLGEEREFLLTPL